MWQRIKKYVFSILGAAIVLYIISRADLHQLAEILKHTDRKFLIVGLGISILPTLINTFKWQLLLLHKKIRIPFRLIFVSQMIGMFVSSFLPSRYSGDAYRTYLVAKFSGKGHDTVASVILQRISGLFVLVVICILGGIFCAVQLQLKELTLVVIAACMMVLVAIGMVFNRHAYYLMDKLLGLARLDRIKSHVQKLYASIQDYRRERKLLLWICGLSLLFYLLAFTTVYLACLAIRVQVPFIFIVFVLPVIYLLEALPISINGFGIREGAFVFFFTKVGLDFEEAFAISLVILLYRLIKTLLGGLFFIAHPTVPRPTIKSSVT